MKGEEVIPSGAGGDDGVRTHDPLLAGQVLSQLSYTPVFPTVLFSLAGCWPLPIFPIRRRISIVGTTQLNFRVRYGYRWTLCVCNTDSLPKFKEHFFLVL